MQHDKEIEDEQACSQNHVVAFLALCTLAQEFELHHMDPLLHGNTHDMVIGNLKDGNLKDASTSESCCA